MISFANLSVNEFHVYTIQYGAYLLMQLSFRFFQLECDCVA